MVDGARLVCSTASPPSSGSSIITILRGNPNNIEARRRRLRNALETALRGASTNDVSAVEAVANAADEVQSQELAFDESLGPALEFLDVMGVPHEAVFGDLLEQLKRQLVEILRVAPRDVTEQSLAEILQHVASPFARDLVSAALQRLATLPPPNDLEQQAISALASALTDDPTHMEQMPISLRRRIWEKAPELLLVQVRPLVVSYVSALRQKMGPLLIDLCREAPEQRRRDNEVLQKIVYLIGPQRELYLALRGELLSSFREAVSKGEPALREQPADGASIGAPVSVGCEPLLSTLRSQVLLSLIDMNLLRPSLSGSWCRTL